MAIPWDSRAVLSAVGGDKAALLGPRVTQQPSSLFPQLQIQTNPALNHKVLIRAMWCIQQGNKA